MKFKIVEQWCGINPIYELYYRHWFKWRSLGLSNSPEKARKYARDWANICRAERTYEVFTL